MIGPLRRTPKRTRYVYGVAATVLVLNIAYQLVNTLVVGPLTPLPVPGLSDWVYLQDALDIIIDTIIIGVGAIVLARLLERNDALQTTTLAGMARVTAIARRIAATGDFTERVPSQHDVGPALSRSAAVVPPNVADVAATFNSMLSQLEEAFEAQRRLLADTSHELRNPLTVMRTNLALLQREDLDEQTRLDAAREAEDETARLARLVDDLLLLGRGETRDLLTCMPVRLDHLVAEVVAEAREAGTAHAIEVTALEEASIYGDPGRLRQVLRNVIGNALRHTPPGTRVEVALTRNATDAQITIADSGPGILPADLPHVFERFYRVDAARTRQTGQHNGVPTSGTGLGLAIVKHLVEAHAGSVAIESEVGRGTVVSLRLPLTPAWRAPPDRDALEM